MEFVAKKKKNLQEESTRELSSVPGEQVRGWGAVSIRTFDSEKIMCSGCCISVPPVQNYEGLDFGRHLGLQNRGVTF